MTTITWRALFDALHEARGKDICIYVKVLGNASTLEEVYFWKTMHKQNWIYLFDRSGGRPQQPATLPTHIKGPHVRPVLGELLMIT